MVANLSAHKRGWDDQWHEFSDWAARGKGMYSRLLGLVDADTEVFGILMEALRLPSDTTEESSVRKAAVQGATRGAIEVPLSVLEVSLEAMEVVAAMAERGLESSVSDAGVGALMLRAAVRAAHLNVQINAGGLADEAERIAYSDRAAGLDLAAAESEAAILEIVSQRIG